MIFNPVYGGDAAASLGTKTITANGTYQASSDNLDGYSEVTANVPNTYAAADEGKVVDNGALVAQTSRSITANGTYDTTLNDEVVVNVSGGGGATLITKTITENGTYNASADNADGYSQVTVNVAGGGSDFPTLPSAYQRVEYLEATGAQAAEATGVTIASGKRIRIAFMSSATSEITIFGFTGSGGTAFDCYTSGASCPALGYGASSITHATSGSLKDVKQFALWTATANLAKAYFCQYRTSGNMYRFVGKIYRLTISDSDSLEWWDIGTADYDFIPCYRISDSVTGFYDAVNDVFYPSTTGTNYIAGPDA